MTLPRIVKSPRAANTALFRKRAYVVHQVFAQPSMQLEVLNLRGLPVVFHDGTQIDEELQNLFEVRTTVRSVAIELHNFSGYTIMVDWDGRPQTLDDRQHIVRTVEMPSEYSCAGFNLIVAKQGEVGHDPIIKLRRENGQGSLPPC